MADGSPSSHGSVTHEAHIPIQIATQHHEILSLKITRLKYHPVILGTDWLHKHNPAIDWRKH
ncbi:hypothetical protein BGZ76_002492, partial [Entomortierella beljakovae]